MYYIITLCTLFLSIGCGCLMAHYLSKRMEKD